MRIKVMFLMSSTLLLAGCYWSEGCLITPQQVNCYYKNDFKVIQAYQKKETIGHTDVEQRKKDALSCGVINYNGGSLDVNTLYPNMTDEEVTPRRLKIYDCMEEKGYIIHSPEKCISKGKPSGFCN